MDFLWIFLQGVVVFWIAFVSTIAVQKFIGWRKNNR